MNNNSETFTNIFLAPNNIPLTSQSIEIIVNSSYNRVEEPTTDEFAIESTWESETLKNNKENENIVNIYNGLKFRLNKVLWDFNKCQLHLGITDYKSNIGTTRNINLYLKVAKENNTNVESFLSNSLGVECFTVTSDNKAIIFCRSNSVAEYSDYFCFPGGHPEPSEVFNLDYFLSKHNNIFSEKLLLKEIANWFENINSKILVKILFDSAIMEVSDEIGVSQLSCFNKGLMSIIQNKENRKPDACFLIKLQNSSEEVKTYFDSRKGADSFESVPNSLLFIDLNIINTEEKAVQFVSEKLHGRIAPASLACLLHGIKALPNIS